MPSDEIVTVEVGGQRYQSWKTVRVAASISDAARSFTLEVAAEAGAFETAWTFRAGAEVKIYFNSDMVLHGYVDRYQPRIDGKNAEITITGRSKTADMIDSAAEKKGGRFEKKNIKQIAEELDKFRCGIEVGEGVELKEIPHYQIVPGETVFRALERMARSQGLALMGTAKGSLKITKGEKKRHAGGIVEGENLLQGEADHNWSNRHSKYIVKGQRAIGSNAENLEIQAAVDDKELPRYRPTVIVVEEDTDKDRAKGRAETRAKRAAGNALKASVTLQGFRDDDGMVWEPNRLIWVESAFLQIQQDMLVESIAFSQDGTAGTKTTLQLVDPKAHDTAASSKGGKTSKKRGVNKSGSQWKTGITPAGDTTALT